MHKYVSALLCLKSSLTSKHSDERSIVQRPTAEGEDGGWGMGDGGWGVGDGDGGWGEGNKSAATEDPSL